MPVYSPKNLAEKVHVDRFVALERTAAFAERGNKSSHAALNTLVAEIERRVATNPTPDARATLACAQADRDRAFREHASAQHDAKLLGAELEWLQERKILFVDLSRVANILTRLRNGPITTSACRAFSPSSNVHRHSV
jgi:hypothetical protein